MALTNFGTLTEGPIKTWSRSLWNVARNTSFVMQMSGKGPNSVIQHITELTKSSRGLQAVMTLLADLSGDGIAGDNVLKDNEEAIRAYDQSVQIDQLRNANRSQGRVAEQAQVVRFREASRDVLGYWLGDRIDQLAFLTLSGIPYTLKTSGALRTVSATPGANLSQLAFAADVSAPSANRYLRWDGTNKALAAGDVTALVPTDTPSYAMLVEAKAFAKTHYIRGVKGPGGKEYFHVFMSPQGIAKLKLDEDFKNAVNNAGVRGDSNPVFSGSIPTVDGLIIHEHRHVFTTSQALALTAIGNNGVVGYKWGGHAVTPGGVNGSATLFCGAQALAMADIGTPDWVEESEDYGNQPGVATGKIFGFLKSKFVSDYDGGAVEDFGILRIDHAI